MRHILILAALVICGARCCLAAENWTEVRSTNFSVLTNSSETRGRQVAREFEQIRSVFEQGFPEFRLQSSAPLIVIVLKDEDSLRRLVPSFWAKPGGMHPAGLFRGGWETSYALVRLDQPENARHIVFHEYIHELLDLNFTRLPSWLSEGLPEFYATAIVSEKDIKIGAPSPGLRYLREHAPIPLTELLTMRPAFYVRDELKARMFYAESWALTHFLIFGPGMDNGKKLDEYVQAYSDVRDSLAAFRKVFGEPKTIESALDHYIRQYEMMVWRMKNPPHADEKTFYARSLSPAEANAVLAGFESRGNRKEAQRLLEEALKDEPSLALAHRILGFIEFHQGNDGPALREFDKAAALDPKDYLAAYYSAMLRYDSGQDPATAQQLKARLMHVRELNPAFPPVHLGLSRLYVSEGKLDLALQAARYAAQVEPGHAGYHLHVARILLRQHLYSEAGAIASAVAARWSGTDRDEAIEIQREALAGGANAAKTDTAEGRADETPEMLHAQRVQGRILAVSCDPTGSPVNLTLDVDGKRSEFIAAKTGFQLGFEDTLWYGADHFSLCHHLIGRPVVLDYKKAADTSEQEILRVRISDPLPAVPAPAAATSSR